MTTRHGGKVLADQLRLLGAERLFCVPGESFLALLDGLHDHRDAIDLVVCRHEGGAANMAEAHAKLTGKPGLCAVTRGPGATNASNGIHTAFQDSTPMILFIGQVGGDMIDREAFQEIDYRRMFGQMAKWVAQIDDPDRIPEYISRAWSLCQSGRPGPVVLALPEDTLSALTDTPDLRPQAPATAAPTRDALGQLHARLAQARRPVMVLGGPGWSRAAANAARDFAAAHDIPAAVTFRRQDYFDNQSEHYAGVLGIGPVPALRRAVAEDCDLLLAVGPRLGEMATQGFTLLDIPNPRMPMVHVHPGSDEIGHIYAPDLAIACDATGFWQAAADLAPTAGARDPDWRPGLRRAYLDYIRPTEVPGPLNMGEVVAHMDATLPEDAILTNGAGNYAIWLHRFFRYRGYRGQLAPTSGSMGYGVPAAIAAKRAAPGRTVICMAGDGCFLMTAQELATAAQYDCAPIFLVVNNGMYGTIRMHQERHYPARVSGTVLANPDFVAYAAAFGIPGEAVTQTAAFPEALARAMASPKGYLIELQVDPEALTPAQSLSETRAAGQKAQDRM